MKYLASLLIFFIMSAYALPLSVYFILGLRDKPEKQQSDTGEMINVYFKEENEIREMELEEYLEGVVAAEMPATFEKEALKAQAVAARSYAVYRSQSENPDHPDADVCTDYTHCKAYRSEDASMKLWGENGEEYRKKIIAAVTETEGEILTYNGSVALTVFHSQSGGGRTENSQDVWGGNYPYLVSVESHGEENAPNFYSSLDITLAHLREKLTAENSAVVINSAADIGEPIKSEGGGVKSITIGGQSFKGSKIRTLFNLRSSCFTIKAEGENVHFEVTGYGHGVGMSQYGANALAKEGSDYRQILTHYYSGTEIEPV